MKSLRLPAVALTVAVVVGACTGGAGTSPAATTVPSATKSMAPTSSTPPAASGSAQLVVDSAAADLRVKLDLLLGEHIIFASKATRVALIGHKDEFAAYGALLNSNGTDLGAAIGSVYGDAAKDSFNKIWSAHNGFFVDYTTGVATKDKAKMDKAVSDLTTMYLPQFADFLAGATGLPNDALTALIKEHVLTTKAVVDAQGTKDYAAASKADQTAGRHMEMIGDPLAKAIVAKVPDKFS